VVSYPDVPRRVDQETTRLAKIASMARLWRESPAARRYPVRIFLLLSGLFGTLVIFLTPPMRGPDEPAHFIRAYGLSQVEIVPSIVDENGRKGIFIPLRLQREMEVFDFARHRIGEKDFTYHQVFADYTRACVAHGGTTTMPGNECSTFTAARKLTRRYPTFLTCRQLPSRDWLSWISSAHCT